jgi:hypothetical protein
MLGGDKYFEGKRRAYVDIHRTITPQGWVAESSGGFAVEETGTAPASHACITRTSQFLSQNNAVVVNDYFHIHVSKGEKQSKKPVDHARLAACCETAPAGGASVGG